jgi:soluble cytochrome b562
MEKVMSVSGISSGSSYAYGVQTSQNQMQQFWQDFKQLGQDLQSGNLSAAQSDFASSTSSSSTSSTSSSQSTNSIAQAFSQLSQDLQSGNLSAAQQDYSTIQQDFQTQATQGHHHHHHGSSSDSNSSESSSSGSNEITQLFDQLGQSLQSGNLSAAQQAYGTLQQDFLQFAQGNGLSSSSQSSSSSISLSA